MTQILLDTLTRAAQHRAHFADALEAYRLFNGFYEGCPGLVLDRYGPALVILDHGLPPDAGINFQALADWAIQSDWGH